MVYIYRHNAGDIRVGRHASELALVEVTSPKLLGIISTGDLKAGGSTAC